MKRFFLGVLFLSIICCAVPVLAEDSDAPAQADHFRVGAGVGIHYGGYGANTEYRINRYASVSAALGYTNHEAPAWAVGASFYPLKNDKTFNPRLSGYYGRVATIDWHNSVGDHRYEAWNGGTLGGGFEWRVYKMLSLDFDLYYIAREHRTNVNYGSDAGASLGIGVVF